MKITLKDNLPGHIGSITHDAEIEPMIFHFTEKDRANIAAMPPGCSSITCYPEGLSLEAAHAHFQSKIPAPVLDTPSPAISIDHSRLADLEKFHLPENHAFRSVYRSLSPSEAALARAIKDQAFTLLKLIELTPTGREQALAKTHLEDSVMRTIRGITA